MIKKVILIFLTTMTAFAAARDVSVEGQLAQYRSIFNVAFDEFKAKEKTDAIFSSYYSQHIKGLYDMLKIGVESVMPLVKADPKLKNRLDRLVDDIEEHEKSKSMFQSIFLVFNEELAYIADCSKGITDQTDLFVMRFCGLINHTEPATFRYEMERDRYSQHLLHKEAFEEGLKRCPTMEIGPVFRPVAIIYSPDPIRTDQFVEQKYGYDYTLDIAQLHIDIRPGTKLTKRDPHYSDFTTSSSLLGHDAFHNRIMLTYELLAPFYQPESIYANDNAFLKKVYQLSKSDVVDDVSRKILENTLFLVGHEYLDILPGSFLTTNTKLMFLATSEMFVTFLKRGIRTRASASHRIDGVWRGKDYKRNVRDLEFAIKTVGLLPDDFADKTKRTAEERVECVATAFEAFWEKVGEILKANQLI